MRQSRRSSLWRAPWLADPETGHVSRYRVASGQICTASLENMCMWQHDAVRIFCGGQIREGLRFATHNAPCAAMRPTSVRLRPYLAPEEHPNGPLPVQPRQPLQPHTVLRILPLLPESMQMPNGFFIHVHTHRDRSFASSGPRNCLPSGLRPTGDSAAVRVRSACLSASVRRPITEPAQLLISLGESCCKYPCKSYRKTKDGYICSQILFSI